MALQMAGNVPGLQNTGVMLTEECTVLLLRSGFTQSTANRRLFYLHGKSGILLMADTSVDDCMLVVQSGTMAAAFNKAWEERYRDPPVVDAAARDFLGLK